MATDKGDLASLELLMNEFFDGRTTNEKRQEIEKLLSDFSNQRGCWRQCMEFLVNTSNQYVLMYCLNIIENVINKQWMGLQWEERAQLKSVLFSYVVNKNTTLPASARCKATKLVVDIARSDWPHFYPDYFNNILQLVLKQESRELGLMFLLTTSEELLSPREDLSVDRKAELKRLLLAHVPQVFATALELLSATKQISEAECSLVLRLLNHLFSWVPASHVPDDVVTIIFKIAHDTKKVELSLLAMATLNEMLWRRWVAPNWDGILEQALNLVQSLLNTGLDSLDPSYLEKVTDFLRLLISAQTCQLDARHHARLESLLTAALSFTLEQPTLDPGFLGCLDIWSGLLENQVVPKYPEAMVSLAQRIVFRAQYRREGGSLLDELDDTKLSDDGETQRSQFLRGCIEVVAKIAQEQPLPVLRMVLDEWLELCTVYGQVCCAPHVSHDVTHVHRTLRDLAALTQAMGRLCPLCSGPAWGQDPQLATARLTVQHLLTLADLAAKTQARSVPDTIKLDFQNVHGQVLAALKAWCYWMALLHDSPATKPLLADIVTAVLGACVPLLRGGTPTALQHCAAHLFATLTCTVRPKCLWEMEGVKSLFTASLDHLQQEDQHLVLGGLVNSLVLTWPKAEDQMWDQRGKLLESYLEEVARPLTSQPLVHSEGGKGATTQVLRALGYLIQLYKAEGSRVKKLLCAALHKSVEHSLALFPVYVKDPAMNQEILQFFLALLECLQQQVGVSFTQVTVQTFMVVYTREQLQVSLAHESGGGLQQLLEILDLILQTPGLSASKLTPMAVTLSLQLAQPILCDTAAPSVREALYQLMYSILVHKWQYFFKSVSDTELRTKEFLLLMKAMGQALFLPDINLFRQVVKNLERLNNKWKLYYKEMFRRELHSEFLTVLLNTLRNKSHTLLNEEIAVAIFNMASVDMTHFFRTFLPSYLDSVEALDASQRQILLRNFSPVTDMPSVIENIFRLVNDLICYQLCAVSVPTGAIKL